MRGIYEAWLGAIEELPDGIYVNMCLNREHTAADIKSYPPSAGRLDVTAKRKSAYYLRPPAWALRESVHANRNGKNVEVKWGGICDAYISFKNVHEEEILSIEWSVPCFIQTLKPISVPNRAEEITVKWIGNTVRSVNPSGQYLPMFYD